MRTSNAAGAAPGLDARGPSSGAVLTSLLLGTFVAGSAEVLTVGLLPLISRAFDVSTAAAGSLLTAYAIGLAVGGPVLAAATIGLDRRHVLVGSMALFAILVIAPTAVPHYTWFVATRLMTGALQGLFLAAAFTTATSVVPSDRTGRAISVVIAGFSISTVIGLPISVLAGSFLGWRGALLITGASALAVTGLLLAVAPTVHPGTPPGSGALRQALSRRVLAVLALALALFAAAGAVMAYLMPLLEQVTSLSGSGASALLVVYGLANVAGSFVGGPLADADPARALVLVTLGLVVSGASWFLARSQPVLALAAILAWAVSAASAPPSVQHRAVTLAGPAAGVVASLPASAASAGIALGSTASGLAYTAAGPDAVVVTAVAIALGALGLALATRRLQPPRTAALPATPEAAPRELAF